MRRKILLSEGWKLGNFKEGGEAKGAHAPEYDDSEWMKVKVPSEVHLELFKRGLIEDPYYHASVDRYWWIPTYEWWYRLRFRPPKGISFSRAFLVFHGLDTLATVWLNGDLVGTFKNMFRRYRIDVTERLLRDEDNVLAIRFSPVVRGPPPKEYRSEEWTKVRPQIRKAQMSFGWDIAPRLLTVGIWRDVELLLIKDVAIGDICVRTRVLKEGEEAEVLAIIQVMNYAPEGEAVVSGRIMDDGQLIEEEKKLVELKKEQEEVTLRFKLKEPKLWWPWDLGEPHLYTLNVRLYRNGEIEDSRDIRFGIREVKLLTKHPHTGENAFTFIINDKPVYVRGINWTPPDAIFTRIDEGRYKELLKLVLDMNANALRIWGGGVYPDDIFYDLCDEMGIMVWQDFMFACAYYPKNQEFLREAEREAEDIVRRFRNHPSLILWCGDNECDAMCHPEGHPLNRVILKRVCERLDPTRPYWPSSPCGGEKPNSPYEGDTHIWHHGEYYKSEIYESELGTALFVSEIGHLSCPDVKTLEGYIPKERMWPPNESYRFGYRPWSLRRLRWLERAMRSFWGKVPEKLEEYIRVSQLLQAEAYKYWVEKCRRRKFNNSGIMLWNVTDCWPQCSDSIIDYYGRPKLAYYYVKIAFSPVLISAEVREGRLSIWVTNDTLKDIGGFLKISHYEYPAEVRSVYEEKTLVPANSSRLVKSLKFDELRIEDKSREYVILELLDHDKKPLSKNIVFLTEPRNLSFSPEELIIELLK